MRYCRGVTIIELMIALVLGLFLISTFLQIMVGASQSTTFHEHLTVAQANGRYALLAMSRSIRLGGYRNPANGTTVIPFFQGGCGSSNPCTFDGGGTNSDQIAVYYEPVANRDCANNTIPAGELTIDVFYVAADTANNNTRTLFCRGYNPSSGSPRGSAEVVVSDIESLQVVYGLEISTEGVVSRYVTAGAVSNWRDVRSVRVGVLVRAGNGSSVFDNRTRQFNLLSSGNQTFNDNTARFIYTTAVKLNNTEL